MLYMNKEAKCVIRSSLELLTVLEVCKSNVFLVLRCSIRTRLLTDRSCLGSLRLLYLKVDHSAGQHQDSDDYNQRPTPHEKSVTEMATLVDDVKSTIII